MTIPDIRVPSFRHDMFPQTNKIKELEKRLSYLNLKERLMGTKGFRIIVEIRGELINRD